MDRISRLLLISLLTVLMLLAGCSENTPSISDDSGIKPPDGYIVHTSPDFSFSISYPETWEPISVMDSIIENAKDEAPLMKQGLPIKRSMVLAVGQRVRESLKRAGYKHDPTLVITIDNAQYGKNSIEEYIHEYLNDLMRRFDDFSELSRATIELDLTEAVLIEFQSIRETKKVFYLHMITLRNKIFWEISISCESCNSNEMKEEFAPIISSFQFLD